MTMGTIRRNLFFLLIGISLLICTVGCGDGTQTSAMEQIPPPPPRNAHERQRQQAGDPEVGRAIFTGQRKIQGVVPCSMCHYVEAEENVLVGPNMDGLSEQAGDRVPGLSARGYLLQSIRDPEAYIVEGFPPGTMNQEYDERLSGEDLEDLIAYLMTL